VQYAAVDLRKASQRWVADGNAQGWSPRTLKDRAQLMERFCWWLENEEQLPTTLSSLDPTCIRGFLAYVRDPSPNGRWGSGHHATKRAARPSTVQTYYRALRAFTNFCLGEGLLDETPLKNVKSPRVPTDQVQPFTNQQVQALVDAARRGRMAERDVAMVMVLVDTGLRVSELCGLKVSDADKGTGELTVTGKGNKRRQVYMGLATRRVLWRYVEAERRDAEGADALFVSVGGTQVRGALTPNGVFQIIQKLGQAAGVSGVRCSPHTLRHTFAVNFLRNGGNLFELQQLMGHADLTVLRRYVALAEADLQQSHRAASPADRMRLR
jgi:integrase/recombinase XerC